MRHPATRPVTIACAVAALALAACRGRSEPEAADRYTFRAEVVRPPDAKVRIPQVVLRHERIPDFKDRSGKVVGMDAMTMPFDVAPEVATSGITAGDKVQVVLAVDWARPSFRVVRMAKLPADTALQFGSAAEQPRP